MSEAQEMYQHAMQQTGINDPADALDALIDSYGQEAYEETCNKKYDAEFEIGDTVQLHSGGPLMTIKEINSQILICRWFDKDDKLQSSKFNTAEIYFKNNKQEKSSLPKLEINEDEIPF